MTVEPPTDKQDDSQDQERRTLKNKPVDAIFAVSRNKEMPTLAADFGKVFIETSNHSCTFLFFRQHPLIKYADVGKEMALEGIEEEAIP